MFRKFWTGFKGNIWQQLTFLIIVIGLSAFGLYRLGVFKFPQTSAYDCSGVTSYLTIDIKITDKFNPNQIDAFMCDHLKFVAGDDAGHWPAAGPHPTHTSYPGFDSNRSLKKGE